MKKTKPEYKDGIFIKKKNDSSQRNEHTLKFTQSIVFYTLKIL